MISLVVGIGDCQVSADPSHILVTYALGSCIGVAIHDPVAGVGGLLHFMLPESSLNPAKAQESPFMFADTGIPLLFRQAYCYGAEKRRLIVSVAGGAQVVDDNSTFNIGKRNHAALRKILWKAGVIVKSEVVGGTTARTLRLEVGSGKLWLRNAGEPECEMTKSLQPGNRGS
jgi:chemotaxis protein CheD